MWQAILTKDALGAVALGIALAYTNTYGGPYTLPKTNWPNWRSRPVQRWESVS